MEFAFLRLDKQPILQETLQDLADMQLMFCEGPRENQNVINVLKHKLMEHVSQNVIDQGLEYCRSIGKSKRHHQIFKVT